MWIRHRLDIDWRDLWTGLRNGLTARDRETAQRDVEACWSDGRDDALACLSVRSAFDLYLTALGLPPGDEVLVTAVTIPDMVTVAKAHELVVVPVDVHGSDYRIDLASLRRAVTPKSRLLLVAHLFGARPNLAPVLELARTHGLVVVEDCAQAWCGTGWRGHARSDAVLFSFGAIKTLTALGGALSRIRDANVLRRMREIQATYPVQEQRAFVYRVLKYAALKVGSSRSAFRRLVAVGRLCGMNADDLLNHLARGFGDAELMTHLRRQPCAALLKLLHARLVRHHPRRIEGRIRNARHIIDTLRLYRAQPELTDPAHSFWLFPYLTRRPATVMETLRRLGFDSTQRGRLAVVPAPPGHPARECRNSRKLLDQTVFLPCYAEMSLRTIEQMCEGIARAESPDAECGGASG